MKKCVVTFSDLGYSKSKAVIVTDGNAYSTPLNSVENVGWLVYMLKLPTSFNGLLVTVTSEAGYLNSVRIVKTTYDLLVCKDPDGGVSCNIIVKLIVDMLKDAGIDYNIKDVGVTTTLSFGG
ncbi:MAG: hypothetical protein GY861_20860 [bacterium]|nr:hypothetical protein [bacterium]